MKKWLQSKLQYWLGIPVLFLEVDKLANRITKLEKTTRQGKRGPQRYDEINRARKRRYKAA
jgi:hypothetical protein